MPTFDSGKLASIAARLRLIPAQMREAIGARQSNSAGEAASVAGLLLVQAIEVGAFSDNPSLLLAVDRRMAMEPEGMKYGRAYCFAVKELLNQPDGTCVDLVEQGCPAIADRIDRFLYDAAEKAGAGMQSPTGGTVPTRAKLEAWIAEAERLRVRLEQAEPIDLRIVPVELRAVSPDDPRGEWMRDARTGKRERMRRVPLKAGAAERQRQQSIAITRRNTLFGEVADLVAQQLDVARAAGAADDVLKEPKPVKRLWAVVQALTGEDPCRGTADQLNAGRMELLTAKALGRLIAAAKQIATVSDKDTKETVPQLLIPPIIQETVTPFPSSVTMIASATCRLRDALQAASLHLRPGLEQSERYQYAETELRAAAEAMDDAIRDGPDDSIHTDLPRVMASLRNTLNELRTPGIDLNQRNLHLGRIVDGYTRLASDVGTVAAFLLENGCNVAENASTPAHAAEVEVKPENDDDYRAGAWFGKSMTARLRKAASPTRLSKRVRKRTIDGVVCYHVGDARRWWPDDVPKA